VTLCHRGRTIKVPKSKVRMLRKQGAKLGSLQEEAEEEEPALGLAPPPDQKQRPSECARRGSGEERGPSSSSVSEMDQTTIKAA
jgi:hypothetical protein